MSADPSSMNSTLLLPDPWMDTSTLALRAAAIFLGDSRGTHRSFSEQGGHLEMPVAIYSHSHAFTPLILK